MEDGQELCDTMISNEAVLFIRDEARDMVVEIVAYATLTCLAYVGQQWDLTIVFSKFFGFLFEGMCYLSRLPFRWQSTTV